MDNQINERVLEFENTYIHKDEYWRIPIRLCKNTELLSIFLKFKELFSSHPSEENTYFYLIRSKLISPDKYTILFWCHHFEDLVYEQLDDLEKFMEYSMSILSFRSNYSASLDKFDSVREEIIIAFYNPKGNMIELFKRIGEYKNPK